MRVECVKFFVYSGEIPPIQKRRYGKKFNLREIDKIGYEVQLYDCPNTPFSVRINACLYNQGFDLLKKNMRTYEWGVNSGRCYLTDCFTNINWQPGIHKVQIWDGNGGGKLEKYFFEVVR